MTFREWASEYAEFLEPGCIRYGDMREAWRGAQKEMRGQAEDACTQVEGELGDEHAEWCACVTVADQCDCHLARFRRRISELPLEVEESDAMD